MLKVEKSSNLISLIDHIDNEGMSPSPIKKQIKSKILLVQTKKYLEQYLKERCLKEDTTHLKIE
jgi:hypothetical protein